ncbi:helix-turn-helix transcriptional regulator [Haladaptatus salinisoli]|uniref:helix-turn-helix transcriptional regulator n=1 Tax=Haladaptatus salinisoli TaxID=2884876 RepID=UPI001D0B80E7|nr:transcriptional regulator FilR1 domain-containing protein [Haladaptatus salinisoli]
MDNQRSFVEYVLRSGARTDVLLSITDDYNSTQELLDLDLASESAVYNALTELSECGLIYVPRTKRWAPTGMGSVVATLIRRQRETENVLRIDTEYWKRHDVTALPVPFRYYLADLSDGTVIRATDTQPTQAEREVERRLAASDSAAVVAPIYNERYSEAFYDGCNDSRLVLDATVLADLLDDDGFEVERNENDGLDIRVADVSFALGVLDGCLLLSLPTLDGSYDSRTEFVAESERACYWGERLFEQVWADGTPIDEHV